MVNVVKAQLARQENTQYSLLLGTSDELMDDYLSTEFEDEHLIPLHCQSSRATCSQNHGKLVAQKKLLFTCIICLVFLIGELLGGYVAHSLAIMTDAAHLLTDFGSILLSLFSLWMSKKPASKSLTYGWHRSEILGGLFSVLSIWVVTAVLLFIAIQRIINNDYEIHSSAMLITSVCAVLVNILMALILHQSPVSHGHSHDHNNTSVRAAFIHVLGDLLQSLGVLLAAMIIYFRPEWKIADPICTFLFSILVVATTTTILKDILEYEQTNTHTALLDMIKLLQTEFSFHNITIQIEEYTDEMASCNECHDSMD
ncbi:hypothetical protein HF521_021597 [Silurus meridionalis]|uniref:Probable proton-coupled zinc antiporter SLC30A3 n=1 Tax=Silurus meridionalis TaxID=175797 RepID=A0A8T0BBX3_SILME|nr:hypothetical protein HF521_021597 [Silurus meridionalis]